MSETECEVIAEIDTFINESGLWPDLLDHLHRAGYSPEEIADAINSAKNTAGQEATLDPSDCGL